MWPSGALQTLTGDMWTFSFLCVCQRKPPGIPGKIAGRKRNIREDSSLWLPGSVISNKLRDPEGAQSHLLIWKRQNVRFMAQDYSPVGCWALEPRRSIFLLWEHSENTRKKKALKSTSRIRHPSNVETLQRGSAWLPCANGSVFLSFSFYFYSSLHSPLSCLET